MSFRFRDRAQAGRALAGKLTAFANQPEVIVLGLPRGGVPVAFDVAQRLQAPLGIFVVRKLGVPGHEELAMGAIASGGITFLNEGVIHSLRISPEIVQTAMAREKEKLEHCERAFGTGHLPALRGRTVILVDDGLATGATMHAAVIAVRQLHPARVIVAAPVAAGDTFKQFKQHADDIVCVQTPANFNGVGQWYENFDQTTDDEVRALLDRAQFGP